MCVESIEIYINYKLEVSSSEHLIEARKSQKSSASASFSLIYVIDITKRLPD